MPTQQELNISSGSLSLIKQRDSGSGVIFVNPADSTVDIKIENYGFEIDNKSVNEHIDTAFSYYKFPARVIIEDVSDADLTAQLEAVTTDTALFYRYQASPMVLPNIDIPSVGKQLKIILSPERSFIHSAMFFMTRIDETKTVDQFQGFKQKEELYNWNNTFFNRVRNEGWATENQYHYGVRYYFRKDEQYRDERLTSIDPHNPHTGDEVGFFMMGWSSTWQQGVYYDQFVIQEPYLKDDLNFDNSYFFKIYNACRYTPAGRRIVELDQIAKKQTHSGTSNGRYINSSVATNEFKNVKFKEYTWDWYYIQQQQVSVIHVLGENGERSSYMYKKPDGSLYIPEKTFKLNYTFDSILDANFKEIQFNQLIDGSQQQTNRFTVTKDVLGYNTDIMFNINIGLSHLGEKSTFIVRLIRYNGLSSNKYDVVNQFDTSDVQDRTVLQITDNALLEKKQLAEITELRKNIASEEKKLATEQQTLESHKQSRDFWYRQRNAQLETLATLSASIAENERQIKFYIEQIKWINEKYLRVLWYSKELKEYSEQLNKRYATRSTLATQNTDAKTKLESIDEEIRDYNNLVTYWTTEVTKTTDYIAGLKSTLAIKQANYSALPNLGDNADIILGENIYLKPGKTVFNFTHKILQRDLNIYDSYAVEILTNSPILTQLEDSSIIDYRNGIAMELIADNTSWEIMPMTEYTKKYTDKWQNNFSSSKISVDNTNTTTGTNVAVDLTKVGDTSIGNQQQGNATKG